MGDRPLFSTTTTRTSHVGQPGYDNEEIWIRFIKRYEPKLRYLAQRHFSHHGWMVDDVVQLLYYKIVNNPTVLAYKPTARFRTVLTKKFFETYLNAIRDRKDKSKEAYISSSLMEQCEHPETDRRRSKLLIVDMVAHNFADLDYDMGRFGPEPKCLDRLVWKAYYIDGKSLVKIALELKRSYSVVRSSFKRAKKQVMDRAENILVSLGRF